MPVDTKKLFNEDLPGAMERNKADALAIGAKYQMNVTGAGEWFIDCTATGPSCTAGTNTADCTITLADEDFQKLYDNPQAGMQLYMGGKLKVAGNPMLAMKLQKLFALKLSFLRPGASPSPGELRRAAVARVSFFWFGRLMRPLQGIRVLDLSRLIPGPFATMVLADMGATVDKVEDPGGGDYLRHMPPAVAGASGAFHALNRNKRSLVLDLKRPEGRALLLRLLAGYDVLFEQFRPGVLERLGLGHQLLRQRFPRLIICALTGYGQSGPLAHRAGHDLNYLARAGILGFQGPAGAPPQVPGFQMADVSGGLWSVIAILGALRERERTGEGAVLDVAMVDGVLGFSSFSLGTLFAGQPPIRGEEPLGGGIAPYSTYLSSDGHPMTLAALEPKFWVSFCAGAGMEADMTALFPGPHQPALKEKLSALFATRTRAEWEDFAAHHDCCLEPVLSPEELAVDPHLAARGLFFAVGEGEERVRQFRTPVTPGAEEHPATPAPRSGQHTDEILREAGLSDEEVTSLKNSQIVR